MKGFISLMTSLYETCRKVRNWEEVGQLEERIKDLERLLYKKLTREKERNDKVL